MSLDPPRPQAGAALPDEETMCMSSALLSEKRPLRRLLLPAFALAFALSGLAPAQAAVLARVDGAEITDADVKAALEDMGAAIPQQIQGPAREAYVLDYLIDSRLVARQAEKDKYGEGPEFEKRMAYYRDKVMTERLLSKTAAEAATDEAMRKIYEDARKAQKPEEEIHARHILTETEDQARAVLERLKKGEDFAKVANEVSKDTISKDGDLGWFTKDRMVPEFADAAFKLAKDALSEPVKSQHGWHVIRLEDKREKPFPAYEEVKAQVAVFVQQKAQSDLILKLREGAMIERLDRPAEGATPADPAPAAPKP